MHRCLHNDAECLSEFYDKRSWVLGGLLAVKKEAQAATGVVPCPLIGCSNLQENGLLSPRFSSFGCRQKLHQEQVCHSEVPISRGWVTCFTRQPQPPCMRGAAPGHPPPLQAQFDFEQRTVWLESSDLKVMPPIGDRAGLRMNLVWSSMSLTKLRCNF